MKKQFKNILKINFIIGKNRIIANGEKNMALNKKNGIG